MNIAIIGGGFTGLTAAYELSLAGHSVTVLEKDQHLGGLAYGFQKKGWAWHIEAAYHHLFTNDYHIISLAKKIGLAGKLIIKRPITATMWRGNYYQLDSPVHLLLFPGLSSVAKVRTALLIGFLKLFPFWKVLERVHAQTLITAVGGRNAWQVIWEPLLYGKFGTFAPTIAASWFWARIVKRTPSLCYVAGGFHTLVTALQKHIEAHKGKIYTGAMVSSVHKQDDGNITVTWNGTSGVFDQVLLTVPTPFAEKIMPQLPKDYTSSLRSIPHVHAQVLILETDRPILNNIYWLNVTDRKFPFLAAVAHTNFMDTKHYGGKHLTYFGNYLPQNHPYLSMTKKELLKTFLPYIKNLASSDKGFRITDSFMFVGPFAQPVHQLLYSARIPPVSTPIPGVFMANMDFVVPWDRGTNYAVSLGQHAVRAMTSPAVFTKS